MTALLLSRSLTGTGRGEISDSSIYFYRKNGTLPGKFQYVPDMDGKDSVPLSVLSGSNSALQALRGCPRSKQNVTIAVANIKSVVGSGTLAAHARP